MRVSLSSSQSHRAEREAEESASVPRPLFVCLFSSFVPCVFKCRFLPARDTWTQPRHGETTSPQRRGGGGGGCDNTGRDTRPRNKLWLNPKTIKLQRWEEGEGGKNHTHTTKANKRARRGGQRHGSERSFKGRKRRQDRWRRTGPGQPEICWTDSSQSQLYLSPFVRNALWEGNCWPQVEKDVQLLSYCLFKVTFYHVSKKKLDSEVICMQTMYCRSGNNVKNKKLLLRHLIVSSLLFL